MTPRRGKAAPASDPQALTLFEVEVAGAGAKRNIGSGHDTDVVLPLAVLPPAPAIIPMQPVRAEPYPRVQHACSPSVAKHGVWKGAAPPGGPHPPARSRGAGCAALANGRRGYIPFEYRLSGVSINCDTPENSTNSSKRRAISCRRIPRIAPFKKTLSRPVRSG